jgi:hypothetical protein
MRSPCPTVYAPRLAPVFPCRRTLCGQRLTGAVTGICRLLRARRERPCRCAAERSDEFAPSKANAHLPLPRLPYTGSRLRGEGLSPTRYLIIMGVAHQACSIHAIGQRLCRCTNSAQSRNLRHAVTAVNLRNPCVYFRVQPPGKKRIRKTNSASASRRPCPAPDPARRARPRALSASPRGAHRTGSSAALRHGARCLFLVRRSRVRPAGRGHLGRPSPGKPRRRPSCQLCRRSRHKAAGTRLRAFFRVVWPLRCLPTRD